MILPNHVFHSGYHEMHTHRRESVALLSPWSQDTNCGAEQDIRQVCSLSFNSNSFINQDKRILSILTTLQSMLRDVSLHDSFMAA